MANIHKALLVGIASILAGVSKTADEVESELVAQLPDGDPAKVSLQAELAKPRQLPPPPAAGTGAGSQPTKK